MGGGPYKAPLPLVRSSKEADIRRIRPQQNKPKKTPGPCIWVWIKLVLVSVYEMIMYGIPYAEHMAAKRAKRSTDGPD